MSMGKESSNRHFFIAIVLVLGAIVFAASLQPESTGQLVTKSNFGPNIQNSFSLGQQNLQQSPRCSCPLQVLYPGYVNVYADFCPYAILACTNSKCYGTLPPIKPGLPDRDVEANCRFPQACKPCQKSYNYNGIYCYLRIPDGDSCPLSSLACSSYNGCSYYCAQGYWDGYQPPRGQFPWVETKNCQE